jgi:hypothetical protein
MQWFCSSLPAVPAQPLVGVPSEVARTEISMDLLAPHDGARGHARQEPVALPKGMTSTPMSPRSVG